MLLKRILKITASGFYFLKIPSNQSTSEPKVFYSYNYNYKRIATTIQVSDTTKQMLDSLKEEGEIESFDELIRGLVRKHTRVPKSMFGADKGMRWKKSDRMDFHE